MRPVSQLLKFAGVGALATLLHVAVALTVSALFGLAPQVANACGFISAVALSYFGQGRLTFEQELKHSFHGPRFMATALTGLLVSSTVTEIVAVQYGAPFAMAMAIVAVAVPLTTYLLCKFWVFKPMNATSAHSESGP